MLLQGVIPPAKHLRTVEPALQYLLRYQVFFIPPNTAGYIEYKFEGDLVGIWAMSNHGAAERSQGGEVQYDPGMQMLNSQAVQGAPRQTRVYRQVLTPSIFCSRSALCCMSKGLEDHHPKEGLNTGTILAGSHGCIRILCRGQGRPRDTSPYVALEAHRTPSYHSLE